MAFFRQRTFDGRTYLYREERWRENGKVKSRSQIVGRIRRPLGGGPSSPGVLVPALPFMIAYELATGSRWEGIKEQRANHKVSARPTAWERQKFYEHPLTVEQVQTRAARHTPSTPDPELKAALAAFQARIDSQKQAAAAPEKSYPAKGQPTDEDEIQNANWSFNQSVQRDEDQAAYYSVTDGKEPDAPAVREGGDGGTKV